MKTEQRNKVSQAIAAFEDGMQWLHDSSNPAHGYVDVAASSYTTEDRYLYAYSYIEVEETWEKNYLSVLNRFRNFPQIEKRLDKVFDAISAINNNEESLTPEDKLTISKILSTMKQLV